MEKAFRVIRVITVPPVFALAVLLTVYFRQPGVFASAWQFVCAILFLSACPYWAIRFRDTSHIFGIKAARGRGALR